jgi:hypothetical protein
VYLCLAVPLRFLLKANLRLMMWLCCALPSIPALVQQEKHGFDWLA